MASVEWAIAVATALVRKDWITLKTKWPWRFGSLNNWGAHRPRTAVMLRRRSHACSRNLALA